MQIEDKWVEKDITGTEVVAGQDAGERPREKGKYSGVKDEWMAQWRVQNIATSWRVEFSLFSYS